MHGNIAAAARTFGVSRTAAWSYIQKRPALQQVLRECQETIKDHAESVLHRKLLDGEPWAVCFFLKCKAKDRGYIERQEIAGAEDAPLTIIREVIDASSHLQSNGQKNGQAAPGSERLL
jgi:hypothetical protein